MAGRLGCGDQSVKLDHGSACPQEESKWRFGGLAGFGNWLETADEERTDIGYFT